MSITLTGSVTGSAVTGLTSPTFTLAADTAPESNGKQGLVSALGGTQSSVQAHTLSMPFTLMYAKPRVFNSNQNVLGSKVQMNKHTLIARKGLLCDTSSTVPKIGLIRTSFEIPVGAETNDTNSVKSMISAYAGWLHTHVDEVATAITSGSI